MDASVFDDPIVPTPPAAGRPAWRRAILVAISIHVSVFACILHTAVGGLDAAPDFDLKPLVTGALRPAAWMQPLGEAESGFRPMPVTAAAYEPGDDVVRQAVQSVTDAAEGPAPDDAYQRLARKARILEEISSRQEVARMAARITAILGVDERPKPATTQPTGGVFDFDRSVLIASTRQEDGDVVRITETLSDPAGRTFVMVASRRLHPETGEFVYELTNIEAGESHTFASSAESFEDAQARHRPFALIDRFPLMRQLHREAVIPILRRLSAPDDAEGPPAPKSSGRD